MPSSTFSNISFKCVSFSRMASGKMMCHFFFLYLRFFLRPSDARPGEKKTHELPPNVPRCESHYIRTFAHTQTHAHTVCIVWICLYIYACTSDVTWQDIIVSAVVAAVVRAVVVNANNLRAVLVVDGEVNTVRRQERLHGALGEFPQARRFRVTCSTPGTRWAIDWRNRVCVCDWWCLFIWSINRYTETIYEPWSGA